jgi:hypothetical protein
MVSVKIGLLGLTLVIVALLAGYISPSLFGSCGNSPYNRFSNPDAQETAWISYSQRRTLVEVLPQFYWLLVFAVSAKRDGLGANLLLLAMYFALWYPGKMLVHLAKASTTDYQCTVRLSGNGISGHFFYFAWALASIVQLRSRLPTPFKPTIAVAATLFTIQGIYTWVYGYHSPQQMCLGAGLGLIFANASYFVVVRVANMLCGK